MATKQETPITQRIIAMIKAKGGDAFHVHGSALQRGGEPDISGEINILPHFVQEGSWTHLKVEVKTEEGEPTLRQLYRMAGYWKRGYLVGVVNSELEFNELLNRFIDWRTFSPGYIFFGDAQGSRLPYAKQLYLAPFDYYPKGAHDAEDND